ncbi:MAG: hypothetical protein CM1200mP38_2210 [Dehalococcoidia bacterium]|nr:MAG: hypothetical protein CM1200mP38_2210 [Dehalococcoidia bacterium]
MRWGTAGTTAETSYGVNQNNDGPFGDLLRNQQFRQALAILLTETESMRFHIWDWPRSVV